MARREQFSIWDVLTIP